jgi:hypothetical protein
VKSKTASFTVKAVISTNQESSYTKAVLNMTNSMARASLSTKMDLSGTEARFMKMNFTGKALTYSHTI